MSADWLEQLLSLGEIPGEQDIPEDLLKAMATLINRELDHEYISPRACRGAAALVSKWLINRADWLDSEEFAQLLENYRQSERDGGALKDFIRTKLAPDWLDLPEFYEAWVESQKYEYEPSQKLQPPGFEKLKAFIRLKMADYEKPFGRP